MAVNSKPPLATLATSPWKLACQKSTNAATNDCPEKDVSCIIIIVDGSAIWVCMFDPRRQECSSRASRWRVAGPCAAGSNDCGTPALHVEHQPRVPVRYHRHPSTTEHSLPHTHYHAMPHNNPAYNYRLLYCRLNYTTQQRYNCLS